MRVLALTHGPSVGPGVFGLEVRAAGHELQECRVAAGDSLPADADAILVFGGAMHPDQEERHPWLVDEQRFLAAALERETPVFALCLGAQQLAQAAGAPVRAAPEPEVGWLPVELTEAAAADPVFASAPGRFDAFLWHQYTYDLPAGAVELARSASCNQAFRLDNAVGIQFHAEITASQIGDWVAQAPGEVGDVEAFRAATRERIGGWNDLGRALCRRFLESAA